MLKSIYFNVSDIIGANNRFFYYLKFVKFLSMSLINISFKLLSATKKVHRNIVIYITFLIKYNILTLY